MENQKEKKSRLSPLVYVTLAAVYLTPNLIFQFMAILAGICTYQEYNHVSKHPVSLLFFLLMIGATIIACKNFKKLISSYYEGKIDSHTVGKKLNRLFTINIFVPITAGIVQGIITCVLLAAGKAEFAAFHGTKPYAAIFIFSLAVVFNFALLFYVFNIRVFELEINDIPF